MNNIKSSPSPLSDNIIRENIKTVVIYALSFSVALGFNNLITSIFNNFYETQHIISKTTYVVILFGITLLTAYWLAQSK